MEASSFNNRGRAVKGSMFGPSQGALSGLGCASMNTPLTAPVALATWPEGPVRAAAWGGFAYVSLFSMWLGFFAWYRGLQLGGMLRVSQVQLLQPFLTLFFALFMLTAARWLINRLLPWLHAHASWPGGVLGFALIAIAVVSWPPVARTRRLRFPRARSSRSRPKTCTAGTPRSCACTPPTAAPRAARRMHDARRRALRSR